MHALDSAYTRLARADEHLTELKVLHDTLCRAQANATVIKYNSNLVIPPGETREVLHVDNTRHPHIPGRCFVLVGDVAHNLRTSRNYLVVQLAVLDYGASGDSNAFPIYETPDQFKGSVSRMLEGLSPAHVTAIEQLQPYNGGQWLEALRRLSNVDRHENLIMVAHDQRISMQAAAEPTADGKLGKIHMKVQIEPVLRIALDNGMPLIETLQEFKTQVSSTLDAFKPEF